MYQISTPNPWTDYVPVMRYSEVLLNLTSNTVLNAVRQRSDATTTFEPASQAQLISLILNERRIEFLGGELRNNDLMRLLQTNPAKGSFTAKNPSDNGYIWPILQY